MCMFKKKQDIERWINYRKETIKINQAHMKENQMELLEMKNTITKNRNLV